MNILRFAQDLACNPKHTRWMVPLQILGEAVLCSLIIWRVPCTWSIRYFVYPLPLCMHIGNIHHIHYITHPLSPTHYTRPQKEHFLFKINEQQPIILLTTNPTPPRHRNRLDNLHATNLPLPLRPTQLHSSHRLDRTPRLPGRTRPHLPFPLQPHLAGVKHFISPISLPHSLSLHPLAGHLMLSNRCYHDDDCCWLSSLVVGVVEWK